MVCFKKAVSPVIATLLLILIAVAAAVLVYVWVTGYASSVTTAGTPELQERIKIDAVGVESATEVHVFVRNIGDVQVAITDVYIIDAASSNVVGHLSTTTGNTIGPGKVKEFKVTGIDPSLEEGRTYIAKAVTENGVEASLSFSYSA